MNDFLNRKFDLLKEYYITWRFFLLAILTGEGALIYNVLSGSRKILILYGIFGLFICIFILFQMYLLNNQMKEILKELKGK